MGIVLIPLMMIYFILAGGILILVIKYTKRKLYRYLAIAVLILIPAWDVILGLLVFLPACLVVPKVAIYETAETDGIYYEGVNNDYYDFDKQGSEPLSEIRQIGAASWILNEGYSYIEARVIKDHMSNPIVPVVYRCTSRFSEKESLPGTVRTNCTEIGLPESPYLVKVTTKQIGTTTFQFKKIIERTSGKILGEYNQVIYAYSIVPFFNWFYQGDGSLPTVRCPVDEMGEYPNGKFTTFEYNVLKPKNK